MTNNLKNINLEIPRDKLVVFIASWYYTHHYFSVKFSSGYAIYFWDVLAAILAVIIYSALFKMIHRKLGLIGKILNFAISFLSSMTVYCILVNAFITKETDYFLPLLNHDIANQAVNYIIITIIALVVWRRREDFLEEKEETFVQLVQKHLGIDIYRSITSEKK